MSAYNAITTQGLSSYGAITIEVNGLTIKAGGISVTGAISGSAGIAAGGLVTGTGLSVTGVVSASGLSSSGTISVTGGGVSTDAAITTAGLSSSGVVTVLNNVYGQTFVTTSDRRLKDDIVPLSTSLADLARVRGVQFTWRSEVDRNEGLTQIGFIAQEVREIFPELVFGVPPSGGHSFEDSAAQEAEDGFLSVNYQGFAPLLVEGVKELSLVDADLTSRIRALEAAMESVLARLSVLELSAFPQMGAESGIS
jgi:hypothetical protein